MTGMQDSLYPDDWKKAAKKDWRRCELLLQDDDAEGSAFFFSSHWKNISKLSCLRKAGN